MPYSPPLNPVDKMLQKSPYPNDFEMISNIGNINTIIDTTLAAKVIIGIFMLFSALAAIGMRKYIPKIIGIYHICDRFTDFKKSISLIKLLTVKA